jgi:hypothetical protein
MQSARLQRLGVGTTTVLVIATGVALRSDPAVGAVGPDVAVTATVTPTAGTTDDVYTYVYRVSNIGDASALFVRLDVAVDGYVAGPSVVVTSPPGCTKLHSGGKLPVTYLECQLGNLQPGKTVSRTFAFRFTRPGDYGRLGSAYDNQVHDANDDNNTASPQVAVAPGNGSGSGGTGGGLLAGLQALLAALLGGLAGG